MNGQFNFGDIRPLHYFLGISVLLGCMLAFVSPDDDLRFNPPWGWLVHLLHWQVQTVLPTFLAVGLHRWLSAWMGGHPLRSLALSGLLTATLFAPFALVSDLVFSAASLGSPWQLEMLNEFLSIAPPIIIFWVAINLPFQLGWQLTRESKKNEAPSPVSDTLPTLGFMQQLSGTLGSDLLYLKSELHYIKVVTAQGSAMVLYSLSTAMEELERTSERTESISGMQVHRSFWIMNHHITEIKRRGREGLITMSNGDKVPVSRMRLKAALNHLGMDN